jgi:hypothetical protein
MMTAAARWQAHPQPDPTLERGERRMIDIPHLAQSSYHLEDLVDGAIRVLRDGSNACVGQIHPAMTGAADDLWLVELGQAKVMVPYPSRGAALAAVCAYADKNPQLAI